MAEICCLMIVEKTVKIIIPQGIRAKWDLQNFQITLKPIGL